MLKAALLTGGLVLLTGCCSWSTAKHSINLQVLLVITASIGYSLLTRFETYSLPQHAPPPEQILDFSRRKEYRMGQKNMTVELPKGISPFGNSWAIEGDSPLTK